MYEPYADAVLPIMFAIATQADLLTSGRGNEFATHGTMIVYAETAPIGIRNMAKNRAPRFVVAVAMALPIVAISMSAKMCSERSLVLEAV